MNQRSPGECRAKPATSLWPASLSWRVVRYPTAVANPGREASSAVLVTARSLLIHAVIVAAISGASSSARGRPWEAIVLTLGWRAAGHAA